MDDTVVIYIQAYNAEHTLQRALESVLRQTYSNWVVYLVDNGSTDGTKKIVDDYAERDHRIICKHVFPNDFWYFFTFAKEYVKNPLGGYLAFLDSDDEYKPDFLEKMLPFLTENKLDVAISGNDFVDARTNRLIRKRGLNQNLFIQGDGFSEYFPFYHQFMRTYWSKLYSIDVVRKIDWSYIPQAVYGEDTLFVQAVFQNAARIGILAGTLYKYYIAPGSSSHRWDAGRIKADRILNTTAHAYLIDKHGSVSPQNEDFLLLVYMFALKDTLQVLFQSDASDGEKLTEILEIFSYGYTKRLAAQEHFGISIGNSAGITRQRTELFSYAAKWLLSLQEVPDEQAEDFCNVGEFVCAAAQNGEGWIFFNKLRVSFLTEQRRFPEAQAKLNELENLLPNDEEITALRKKLNELRNASLSDQSQTDSNRE
jgi:glycosyltransferase involved in cell wall biosynthesis